MVRFVTFIPSTETISSLGRLHGTVSVFQKSNLIGGATKLLLVGEDDYSLRIFVDYNDIYFKFECFGLEVETEPLPPWTETRKIATFDSWQTLKCLFRFEWERRAIQGEVPVNWEQIIRKRGKRYNITNKVLAIGVSMVGLVFWNSSEGYPVGSVSSNDDDPATLRVTSTERELKELMDECECVDLNEVPSWATELQDWFP